MDKNTSQNSFLSSQTQQPNLASLQHPHNKSYMKVFQIKEMQLLFLSGVLFQLANAFNLKTSQMSHKPDPLIVKIE
jgi:hypothetical protein